MKIAQYDSGYSQLSVVSQKSSDSFSYKETDQRTERQSEKQMFSEYDFMSNTNRQSVRAPPVNSHSRNRSLSLRNNGAEVLSKFSSKHVKTNTHRSRSKRRQFGQSYRTEKTSFKSSNTTQECKQKSGVMSSTGGISAQNQQRTVFKKQPKQAEDFGLYLNEHAQIGRDQFARTGGLRGGNIFPTDSRSQQSIFFAANGAEDLRLPAQTQFGGYFPEVWLHHCYDGQIASGVDPPATARWAQIDEHYSTTRVSAEQVSDADSQSTLQGEELLRADGGGN